MAVKRGVWVECDNCHTLTYKTPYQYKIHKNHFCSKECEGEYKHSQNSEVRQCEFCGKPFTVRKSLPQRFCCVECQAAWQRTIVGKLNPRFTSVEHKCDYCGKVHYVRPYKLTEFEHLFCSTECRQKWYAEVWSQRPEWREESAKRAVDILSSGKMSRTDSSAQRAMNSILEDLGIEYITEYPMGRYSVDNYLPRYNMFIEVMGDYWHVNPTVYDEPVYEMQTDRIRRDSAKHDYIVNSTGIEPLYVWESDLELRPELCKSLVEKYTHGQISNYHSFNFDYFDGDLTPKDHLIIPFQELNMFTESVTTTGGV